MVHLTIDIGNTATKAAIHAAREEDAGARGTATLAATQPLQHRRVEGHDLGWLRDFVGNDEVCACIVSSTIDVTAKMQRQIEQLAIPQVIRLDAATPIPIRNAYETPETLGPDRLAAAIGAYYETVNRVGEHRPVLVIDAGTAITYDLVTADGKYLGGNISPGIRLRFLALHEHTAHLPLVNSQLSIHNSQLSIGANTHSAILHGVMDGVRHEIEGFISEFSGKYDSLFVFLTGGDTINFTDSIKNRIFADEFLVSKGLDLILQYNKLKV